MIEIELHLCDEPRVLNADPVQVEQLLVNLAVNAKDAMPEGGKLSIATANVVLDKEYCQTHPEATPGEYVLLTVSDTGHGMDRKTLEHIFDPFYTTKEVGKGTGLGLAMVYGIVKNHAGYITCTSKFGEGTDFKIYLPPMEHLVEVVDGESSKVILGCGQETILLVDDEEDIREFGKELFGRCGYNVRTVADGESALALYRKEGKDIDLVILDLIMPGMGGRQFLEELLKINPTARVLVASGHHREQSTAETLEAGAKGFIKKPYNAEQILAMVRTILDQE
jgi:CheY-like chemotaxis protein